MEAMNSTRAVKRIAAATLALAGIIGVTYRASRLPFTSPEKNYSSRQASIALPDGGCKVLPAVAPDHPITPTFTASYPGSGAKMTWNLIEALTGLVTGDEWNLNGHHNMVTIKSHYPHPQGQTFESASSVPRAILLLRNPLDAMPSYLNFLYEIENDLPGHSSRAPYEKWITWRNDNFDEELDHWRSHTEYWMNQYDRSHRIILSYEGLTSDAGGANYAKDLADFLRRSEGVDVIEPEAVPCVWRTVIKYKGKPPTPGGGRRLQEVKRAFSDSNPADPKSYRSGKVNHPYTRQQLDDTIVTLERLIASYPDDPDLGNVLKVYIDSVNGVKKALGFPKTLLASIEIQDGKYVHSIMHAKK